VARSICGQCDGADTPCTPAQTNTQKNQKIANAITAGANGAPVGAGELMNSQLLAGYFGLSANPTNQPSGTNYAISGATNSDAADSGNANQNKLLPSTVEQVGNYLAANGGVANESALYLISSGGNDISYIRDEPGTGASRRAFLDMQADTLIEGIGALKDAGARYFVVDSNHGAGGPGTLGEYYTQQLWTGLAAADINFIPADISALVRGVQADPTRFGFTAATVNPGVVSGGTSTGSACVIHSGAAGPTVGWGQWCVNATTPSSQYAYLASARRSLIRWAQPSEEEVKGNLGRAIIPVEGLPGGLFIADHTRKPACPAAIPQAKQLKRWHPWAMNRAGA